MSNADRLLKVGDDVHYVSYGYVNEYLESGAYSRRCLAAKVTEVCPDGPGGTGQDHTVVRLVIFRPNGLDHDIAPPDDGGGAPCTHLVNGQSSAPQSGTWHWPEC